MRFAASLSLLLFLSSCHQPPLEVDLVYVGARSLASFWVCTPDPQLVNPPVGQKLVLLWRIPKHQWEQLVSPVLHLQVRFINREEKSLWWDIKERSGKVFFSNVFNPPAPEHDIRTYRAEILDQGKVIYMTEQMLWTPWIELNVAENQEEESCEARGEEPSALEKVEQGEEAYRWEDLEPIQ